ncbi:2391_t:CDS:2 [Funneliformis caledonium]|uniref:2391_t:CDS:1 n=1 Tax=Funneliformis caledonium TaxID=1117310 RepID=A0A9N8V2B0_9GLOM|nr:2391_t:CDS:2 [Funneliformis caledonium]
MSTQLFMKSCTNDSIKIIGYSFVTFILLNYVTPICATSLTTFYNKLDKRKKAIWDNTFVSYIHAWICSIITPVCFYYYPHAWHDMIYADVSLCRFQIALSTGYFFADMFDFWIKNIFMDSPGIWFHHVVVITTFFASIVTCQFSPYLVATLLVEISNVFLHQRKLYLTSFKTKSTSFYQINSLLLLLTFIFARFTVHGYLTIRVWREYKLFENIAYWRIAFLGMIAMNVLNLQLFLQLWSADWSKMILKKRANTREL